MAQTPDVIKGSSSPTASPETSHSSAPRRKPRHRSHISDDMPVYRFSVDGHWHHIKVHPGFNKKKTAQCVADVLGLREDIHHGMGRKLFEKIDADVDVNCILLSKEHKHGPLKETRFFDLACAYGNPQMVEALLQHPKTPVGETFGFLSQHSALTFLAKTIVDEGHESKKRRNFPKNNLLSSRLNIFRLLIEDPRTPVDHQDRTYSGSESLDAADILKRHDTVHGCAYYPIVRRFLEQRKTLLALHHTTQKPIEEAFAAANKLLMGDPAFRHMKEADKTAFLAGLNADIEREVHREGRDAFNTSPDERPLLPSHQMLNPQVMYRNYERFSAQEKLAARRTVAKRIWMNCADLACKMNNLIDFGGRPSPKLPEIATSFATAFETAGL